MAIKKLMENVMNRITRFLIMTLIVLTLAALTASAQARKGQSSPKATPVPEQKKTSPSASRAENQQPNRSGATSPQRELSSADKRNATKLQILSLTGAPFTAATALAKVNFKVDVPDGVEVLGFDAVFEAQFSNGEIKTAKSSAPPSRLNVQAEFAFPVISAPAFDCSICQNLSQFEKGEREVREQQCIFNGCPIPTAPKPGGPKDKEIAKEIPRSGKTAISTRSTSNGRVLADLTNLKVTVTARFNDNASRGGFTKVEQKTQVISAAKNLSPSLKR